MKLAVMQPYFCPYLGYFHLMHAVDRFVIFDDVNFIKKGWINRNRILVNNAEHLFTIPLMGMSQNRTIRETEIKDDGSWRGKLITTIERAYKKAPQFAGSFEIVRSIVSYSDRNLAGFLANSIRILALHLGLKCVISDTSSVYGNRELKGQDRIIDICIKEKADRYCNAIGGTELYDRVAFARNGIELQFVRPHLANYKQSGDFFVSGLSIIDVLMWNSLEKVQAMVSGYELVQSP